MKTYFESNPKETMLSKEENVFWKGAMDCGFYNKKPEGLFRKYKDDGLRSK